MQDETGISKTKSSTKVHVICIKELAETQKISQKEYRITFAHIVYLYISMYFVCSLIISESTCATGCRKWVQLSRAPNLGFAWFCTDTYRLGGTHSIVQEFFDNFGVPEGCLA